MEEELDSLYGTLMKSSKRVFTKSRVISLLNSPNKIMSFKKELKDMNLATVSYKKRCKDFRKNLRRKDRL